MSYSVKKIGFLILMFNLLSLILKMKNTFIISIIFLLFSCQQKNETKSSESHSTEKSQEFKEFVPANYNFQLAQEQADSLIYFMNEANNSDSITRRIWEQKFFRAFPNSFSEMESLFAYDSELGAAPLYSTENPSYKYMDERISSDVIGFFSQLQSIPSELYYKKYTNINIDGNWQADNIREAFGFNFKLHSDTKNACLALSKYTDEEISSVFRFIFDGPHPKNEHNEKIYHNLKLLLEKQNHRLEKLLTLSFDQLMSEDHGH